MACFPGSALGNGPQPERFKVFLLRLEQDEEAIAAQGPATILLVPTGRAAEAIPPEVPKAGSSSKCGRLHSKYPSQRNPKVCEGRTWAMKNTYATAAEVRFVHMGVADGVLKRMDGHECPQGLKITSEDAARHLTTLTTTTTVQSFMKNLEIDAAGEDRTATDWMHWIWESDDGVHSLEVRR